VKRAAAAALLACWCGAAAVGAEATVDKEREADAVLEAVFASLLREAAPTDAEAVCLAVRRSAGGKEEVGDPGEALLARLQKQNPRVRKSSECKRGRGQPATETATGGPAVVLDIGPVNWSGDEARVGGGFTRGHGVIREWEYDVAREGASWTVRKATLKKVT
jgi:hypothetical protein